MWLIISITLCPLVRGRTLPCSYGQLILEPCLEIWWCATRVQAMCPLGKCFRPPFLSLPIACLSFEFFLNVTEIWPVWNTTLVSGLFLITVTRRIDLGLLQMDIFFGVNSSRVLNFTCLFICLSTIAYGVSIGCEVNKCLWSVLRPQGAGDAAEDKLGPALR